MSSLLQFCRSFSDPSCEKAWLFEVVIVYLILGDPHPPNVRTNIHEKLCIFVLLGVGGDAFLAWMAGLAWGTWILGLSRLILFAPRISVDLRWDGVRCTKSTENIARDVVFVKICVVARPAALLLSTSKHQAVPEHQPITKNHLLAKMCELKAAGTGYWMKVLSTSPGFSIHVCSSQLRPSWDCWGYDRCLCNLGQDKMLTEDHLAGCKNGGQIVKRHDGVVMQLADGCPPPRDGGDQGAAGHPAWIWPRWPWSHVFGEKKRDQE